MPNNIWQDREIRFDISKQFLNMGAGEQLVQNLELIEDVKGNQGEKGTLKITSLRLIWYCNTNPRINLSIGLDCLVSVDTKEHQSMIIPNQQSLNIRSRYQLNRFEFIFKTMAPNSQKIFQTFMIVARNYEQSKMYRDLKLRGAIINDKNLILLENECVINKYNEEIRDPQFQLMQGNNKIFDCFNNLLLRIVWFSNLAQLFNISVPYIQVKSIKLRDSKLGNMIAIETSARSGNYLLGFQTENQGTAMQEMVKLHQFYSENPILGYKFEIDASQIGSQITILDRLQDEFEIDNNIQFNSNVMNSYLTQEIDQEKDIIYSPVLGLAVEKPAHGVRIEDLQRPIGFFNEKNDQLQAIK